MVLEGRKRGNGLAFKNLVVEGRHEDDQSDDSENYCYNDDGHNIGSRVEFGVAVATGREFISAEDSKERRVVAQVLPVRVGDKMTAVAGDEHSGRAEVGGGGLNKVLSTVCVRGHGVIYIVQCNNFQEIQRKEGLGGRGIVSNHGVFVGIADAAGLVQRGFIVQESSNKGDNFMLKDIEEEE